MSQITQVVVRGLNQNTDIRIALRGRHCIMVGPNGSGKSTFLTILACALGRQWRRLSNLRFDRLELEFADNKHASISRNACEQYHRAMTTLAQAFPSRVARNIQTHQLSLFFDQDQANRSSIERLATELRVPQSQVRQMRQFVVSAFEDRSAPTEVADFDAALTAQSRPPVIYLPTYRRIELELRRLFEGSPEALRILPDITTGMNTEFVIEVIRFGMEDVTQSVQSFERDTRDFARNRFNRMMTSYIKEMASSTSLSVAYARRTQLDHFFHLPFALIPMRLIWTA